MVMLKDKLKAKQEQSTTAPADPPMTEGLTPLDIDRASSVADEGGASAATTEYQRPATEKKSERKASGDLTGEADDCGCGPAHVPSRHQARTGNERRL